MTGGKSMTLSELLQAVPPFPDLQISGLTLDSRLVKPGDIFCAIKGTQLDGQKFIEDAITRGAVAVLTDESTNKTYTVPVITMPNLRQKISAIGGRFYDYPAKALEIVGVTGTNGKTSCTQFIGSALKQLNISCGVIGTLGSGLYGNIQSGSLTTPDAFTLQKTFADWRDRGVRHVAMEVSSHGLDQGRVNDIPFTVGIFTNLTRDHLDYHGTMEAYGNAKKKLFINPLLKNAVVNYDDPFGRALIDELKQDVFAYSMIPRTSRGTTVIGWILANNIKQDDSGLHAEIITPWGQGELLTTLIGQFNLSNLLAVLTTLCLLKIPFEKALYGISQLSAVPGRMERFGGENKPLVIVDYSHTPDSLEKALKAIRLHCKGKLYCVFGCGGDRDRGKRPLMAKIAESYADYVTVTDDNPREEDPDQITYDIFQGFSHSDNIILQHDRSKAIQNVIQYAKPNDCILIAGKGAEMYQLIGDKKIPFNDAEEVISALGEKSNARLD